MRFLKHFIALPLVVLVGVEALALFVAPVIAAWLLSGALRLRVDLLLCALTFSAAALVASTALGLYSRRQRASLHGILLRTATAIAVGELTTALLAYVAPALYAPRGLLLLTFVVALVVAGTARASFDYLVDDETFKRRVLVYGAGRRAASIVELRRRSDRRGFNVIAFVQIQGELPGVTSGRAIALESRILEYCRTNNVDEVVVAMEDRRRAFPVYELLECRLNGITVTDIVDFLERETGKVRLDVLNPGWIIFSPGFDRSRWHEAMKRVLDLGASLALLVASAPLVVLTAIAIKLEDGPRAPLLYRQRRVGRDGQIFEVMKFRSMRVDAERPGSAVWAAKSDSRVTKVGSIIRKVRIDELPQIFNVLKGEMSLVGPRPERPEFVADLGEKIPYYRERHCVKPGITGWAQLCYPYGSSQQDAAEKLQYDLYYVKNHSLLFDVMILLQTAEVVLWGQGAR